MANLLQLRSRVRARLGVPASDSYFRDEVIDNAVNEAVETIESEHRWPWSEAWQDVTLSSGQTNFRVPDDWEATRSVIYRIDELMFVTPYDLERFAPPNVSGAPSHYTIVDQRIHVKPDPKANTDLRHLYYRYPVPLIEDDDVPRIPNQHAPTIVAKACQLLRLRESDTTSAGLFLVDYEQGMDRMRKQNRKVTRPVGRRIRPGAWV